MINTEMRTEVRCDRCSRDGNPDRPNRKPRFFSPVLRASHHVPTGFFKGWFIGRKWQYCPACAVIENKQSQAGRSKVINLNEQREAV